MKLAFLTIKNLGFENNINTFYIKNHRNNNWTRVYFPLEKMIRGADAFLALIQIYLSVERRHSDDLLNEATNILVDKKSVNAATQLPRILYSSCIAGMKEIGLTLPDVQYISALLEPVEKEKQGENQNV